MLTAHSNMLHFIKGKNMVCFPIKLGTNQDQQKNNFLQFSKNAVFSKKSDNLLQTTCEISFTILVFKLRQELFSQNATKLWGWHHP